MNVCFIISEWRAPLGPTAKKLEVAIRDAAVDLIARHGYEAVSMRQLAAEVGVQAAALYRYFPTKEDLLFALMEGHMRELAASWGEARPASSSPGDRLAAFVDHHIRFHIARRHATHVSNMELRSLSKARLTAILKLRTAYEKELRSILREGADSRRLHNRRRRTDSHGYHSDDHRRYRLVPAGRAAVGGGCREDLSRHDDAARRPQGG